MLTKTRKLSTLLIPVIFILILSIFPANKTLFCNTDNNRVSGSGNNENYIEVNNFYICEIEGIIDPPISNFISKCLKKSSDSGYGLIILIDTPGGLEASMREIITEILNTEIPVIVFVYPEGARAASAGTFITLASDIAAMAPLASIGAAHPVNLGGQQQISEDMLDKVVNDSVSYIKNLALSRGRNSEWAEKAVRESSSITAAEALQLKVIDITASDIDDLLANINGKILEKSGKTFIINSTGSKPEKIEINFITNFLHIIGNPNIAYILFILGILGIIYEFSQPGLGISGALGVLFLIIGFYSFSILPINYAGLALIILAVILFILDIILGLGGIPSIVGVVSLIIGSFLLINTGAEYLQIARSLIISTSVVVSGFILILIRAVHKIRRLKPVTGSEGIIGEIAVVCRELNPEGQVKVSGEIWKAVSVDEKTIKEGEKVKIISVEGLTLFVNSLNRYNNSSNNNKLK